MTQASKGFVHTVYFWLKEGTTDAARDQLVTDCREILASVETVRQLWAAPPAQTPRDVVDNSYGVGLTVVFDDRAGHDIYQKHDRHNEFIKRNEAIWERVQVYDYV